MSPTAIAFSIAIAIPAAFAAGVLVHKYVVSEAEKIKQHVTAAETRIRGDVAGLVSKVAGRL